MNPSAAADNRGGGFVWRHRRGIVVENARKEIPSSIRSGIFGRTEYITADGSSKID